MLLLWRGFRAACRSISEGLLKDLESLSRESILAILSLLLSREMPKHSEITGFDRVLANTEKQHLVCNSCILKTKKKGKNPY